MRHVFGLDLPIAEWADEEGVDGADIRERLTAATDEQMAVKAGRYGADTMRSIEKQVLLQTIDQNWREHLVTLDHLRGVVGFRGYAQRDPLNEYKSEGFQLFETLLNRLRVEVSRMMAHVQVMTPEEQQAMLAEAQARAQAAQPALPPPSLRSRPAFPRWPVLPHRRWPRAWTRPILAPGGPVAATTPVLAARARSTSIATGVSERPRQTGKRLI